MPQQQRTPVILGLLQDLKGLEPLKQLFWTELNYSRINQPISRQGWPDTHKDLLAEDPILFAGAGDGQGFHIIYARLASDKLRLTPERLVVSKLLSEHPYALFVFSNHQQDRWHLVNVKHDRESRKRRLYRRITVGPEERLRTAAERIAMLDVTEVPGTTLFGVGALDIQTQHDTAFDVEAVTKEFFDKYRKVFRALQDDLERQTGDRKWAHDYALQFLNRLMFIYFIQRKRWLGDNTEFLRDFWEAYRDSKQPRDTFFRNWMAVLFFEAFNKRFDGGRRQFPEPIREALQMAPYLNGGLFARNRLDEGPEGKSFEITDKRFECAFGFFEGHNFTIAEDSPLDQEVAVDPEMIGKVYEMLVNVSDEADERGDAGIFYTPRTEIDLMCRLALVDNLANHLGRQHNNLLYELVFALEPDDKENADRQVTKAGLWRLLDARLRNTTVVDPACGSGSFLVGMLHVLDDLQVRAARHLGIEEDAYDRKKRIIGESLYGVDVMEWACHIAELRLWLALVIDAEFTREELAVRADPLLPHFTFKIRCGDSLVQEIGQVNMAHIKGAELLPSSVRRKIEHHQIEKLRFYANDSERQYTTEEEVRREELRLFRQILDAQYDRLQIEIIGLEQKMANPVAKQIRLDGTVEPAAQMELQAAQWQQQIEELQAQQARVQEARQALAANHRDYFVWDIAFVEVFLGESDGFDIVIGNPPYVRHENIADPRQPREQMTTESKRRYKAKLARSVCQSYPSWFGSDADRPTRNPGAKNDLYVYFYFHGLSLLNREGSFCFITSNSWLDVGYGADLQEFLLNNCHVKLILDNQARRSFADADVNTVIVLFSAPQYEPDRALQHTARFAMLTVPFERVVDAIIFEEIEEAADRRTTAEYRVFPISQQQLLQNGCEPGNDAEGEATSARRRRAKAQARLQDDGVGKYTGDKWGGKYLRAPDIYWKILEKGRDKLVRLGDIAQVRRGFTTGANDFFYLPSRYFDIKRDGDYYRLIPKQEGLPEGMAIEGEYVRPAVLRLISVTHPILTDNQVSHRCVFPPVGDLLRDAPQLQRYLRWGEQMRFHTSATCRAHRPWYNLGDPKAPNIMVPRRHKRRPVVLVNACGALGSDGLVFVYLHEESHTDLVAASLFTTFDSLQREVLGMANFGQGVLETQKGVVPDFCVINPAVVKPECCTQLIEAFHTISHRPIRMTYDDVCMPDRTALDDAFLAAVGFDTAAERHKGTGELQDATCRIIWHRMSKTNNSREARQTYDDWLASGKPFGADVEEEEG